MAEGGSLTRSERTALHPARTAVVSGLAFALVMSVYFATTQGAAGIFAGLLVGALFGPFVVWVTLRANRR